MKFVHNSVMAEECIEFLNVRPDGVYVDCTAGGGGHSQLILDLLDAGTLIDFDKDEEALSVCRKRFENRAENVVFIHDDYKNIAKRLDELSIDKVDGIIADFGVSSYQIDNKERGFSYMANEAPLDMRMDGSQTLTAADVVNGYSESELIKIFTAYGEEDFARVIARNILAKRADKPLKTCGELVEITDSSLPAAVKRKRGHSAKRVFQALRIEVNGELDGLDAAVSDMIISLKSGGRLVILTFHSLEDRIVKNRFKDAALDCVCPKEFPVCVCGHRAVGKILTKKPVVAAEEELKSNPRAGSAKLRALEKL